MEPVTRVVSYAFSSPKGLSLLQLLAQAESVQQVLAPPWTEVFRQLSTASTGVLAAMYCHCTAWPAGRLAGAIDLLGTPCPHS